MNFIITQLSPDEWQKYRDIRLEALKADPLAFASSLNEEVKLPEKSWRDRIHNMWFAMFNNQPVGMAGLLRHENESSLHCGNIISLWVKPEFQGRGIAKALIRELRAISLKTGIKKLSLEATITQQAAIRLYETMGFEKIALLKANLYKDGKYLDEYLMEWHET